MSIIKIIVVIIFLCSYCAASSLPINYTATSPAACIIDSAVSTFTGVNTNSLRAAAAFLLIGESWVRNSGGNYRPTL